MSGVTPRGNSFLLGLFLHSTVDDSDLTVYEFRVYAHLCRRAGDELRVWEGQKKIAAACRMSRAAAQKALYGLRAKGWIDLVERFREDGSQGTNDILICGPPASEKGTPRLPERHPPPLRKAPKGNPEEGNPEKKIRTPKPRAPSPFFDAVALGCYGTAEQVTNEKRVGAVAAQLKKAGWTPEEILSVLSAVKRKDKWWREKGISPDSFLKNCDLWRSKYGRKEEAGPPVVTGETTPADDLDWTGFE